MGCATKFLIELIRSDHLVIASLQKGYPGNEIRVPATLRGFILRVPTMGNQIEKLHFPSTTSHHGTNTNYVFPDYKGHD
jgi:hypothetical protein